MASTRLTQADRTRTSIDWGEQIERHPLLIAAAVAAAGFVFGALSTSDAESRAEPAPHKAFAAGTSAIGNAVEVMAEALVAAASVKAADYIEEWLPGYRDQFSRRLG